MKIYVNDTTYQFEIKTFIATYGINEELVFVDKDSTYDMSILICDTSVILKCYQNEKVIYEAKTNTRDLSYYSEKSQQQSLRRVIKRLIKGLIYDYFLKCKGIKQKWGILTGIRPTKVALKLLEEHQFKQEKVIELLKKDYRIEKDKINLMLEVVKKEQAILASNDPFDIHIYIGIPFCPTRCLYCSFTSFPLDKYKQYKTDYLQALLKEIDFITSKIKDRKIRTIYIGGGTPTSLDACELELLLSKIHSKFDLSTVKEYTVEAGRPDTITIDKLKVLKKYGVSRISINPQTMNQETLNTIGRNHTVNEVKKCYQWAKEIGFSSINMDVIVGLPGETMKHIHTTMSAIKRLAPDNVTVHTLAIKRASKLREVKEDYTLSKKQEIEEMLSATYTHLSNMGLTPYYLYRQKNILGNLENVGFSKPNKACIYNVQIIEEKQTIIALGAGAVSKIVSHNGKKISRIENVKDVKNYIERIDEMLERKKEPWGNKK